MSKILLIIISIIVVLTLGLFYLVHIHKFNIPALLSIYSVNSDDLESVKPYKMAGNSMYPNLKAGQYWSADVNIYNTSTIQRGDVVVFSNPRNQQEVFIKRVIGLPGETIKVQNYKVYISNQVLEEKYLASEVITRAGDFLQEGKEISIPPESYIIMGDNRPGSEDSRIWGFITKNQVKGKVTTCYRDCD